MKWYIGLGVICVLLVICAYNMYNRFEQEDIEIETRLIQILKENEKKRETLSCDYTEILIRSEERLMEYKESYDFSKDLDYVNWEKECVVLTSYPIERCTYKRKNRHNKYYLLDLLYKNKDRNVYVYIITGKNYIQYETAGMNKKPEFK